MTDGPIVIDYGKLMLLAVIVVGMFVLRMNGQVEDAGFYSVIGGVVGYITGNGNLARKGAPPQPMIGREPEAG